jgi:hypothetical protein
VHICRRISDLQGNGAEAPFPPLTNMKNLKTLWARCFLINHHVMIVLRCCFFFIWFLKLMFMLQDTEELQYYWTTAWLCWRITQIDNLVSSFYQLLYISFWTLLAFTLSYICLLGGDTPDVLLVIWPFFFIL